MTVAIRHASRSAITWVSTLLVCCPGVAGCEGAAAGSDTNTVVFEECWFKPRPGWPQSVCGILKVPEDYSKTQGRTIRLPFIVFKTARPRQSSVPLVVAGGGGPGVGLGIAEADRDSFDSTVWASWSFATIHAGRNLILIDNRGVGSAVPRLDCHEIEDAAMALLDRKLERDALKKLLNRAYAACKQRLLHQGIDLGQYHAVNAARDLEQLRVGLGYDQLNVYGASYSSRIALVYERLYPESVRSLILDSVFPQSIETYEHEPKRNYQAIMRVIDKCNRDRRCARRYGTDLDTRLAAFLKQLDDSPVSIAVNSPVDDKPLDVKVTPQMFFQTLYRALYDADVIRRIPRYLHGIFGGDRDYLKELIAEFYVSEISVDSIDEGAYASYACFDDFPFVDFEAAREALKNYPFQHYSNQLVFDHLEAMCEVWAVPAAPADYRQTYRIDTPLLIYAGELDPVTPVEFARPVTENASRWWAALWPDVSHHVMAFSECADWTAAAFLRDPMSDPFIHPCARIADRSVFE